MYVRLTDMKCNRLQKDIHYGIQTSRVNVYFNVVCSWRKLFKSRLFNALTSYANIYFTIFIAILIILFLGKVHCIACNLRMLVSLILTYCY